MCPHESVRQCVLGKKGDSTYIGWTFSTSEGAVSHNVLDSSLWDITLCFKADVPHFK